jgi:hypothetical protein
MAEHDEVEGTEEDVEAHGLKEVAVTGLSAAAMIVGAGDALAATTPGNAAPGAKQAVHKIDAAQKGAMVQKDATHKGAAVNKHAALKGHAVSKQSADPTLKRSGPGAT